MIDLDHLYDLISLPRYDDKAAREALKLVLRLRYVYPAVMPPEESERIAVGLLGANTKV